MHCRGLYLNSALQYNVIQISSVVNCNLSVALLDSAMLYLHHMMKSKPLPHITASHYCNKLLHHITVLHYCITSLHHTTASHYCSHPIRLPSYTESPTPQQPQYYTTATRITLQHFLITLQQPHITRACQFLSKTSKQVG